MNKKNRNPLRDAIKILGISEASESRIKEYLRKKGYSQEEISQTVYTLKKNNYIDDERLARLIVEKYLEKNKGRKYIHWILCKKGVSENIISTTLARLYPESLEYKKAKELLLSSRKPLRKALKEIVSAGFSEETIEKIMEETGEE